MGGEPESKIQLQVLGITNASHPDMYTLLLGETSGEGRKIPIIIGLPEAQSIAVRLQGLRSPRPLTHDIFMTMALSFQIEMIEAIIYKCANGVFFSQVVCKREEKIIYIDSRTSDAVALAIRFNAPIYTYNSVFEEALEKLQELTSTMVNNRSEEKEEAQDIDLTDRDSLSSLDDKTLQELMQKAISEEDYEQASIIRDVLNSRK